MQLVTGLTHEWGSHLNMSLLGNEFAAGYGETMTGILTSAYGNYIRDVKKHPKPFVFPLPFKGEDEGTTERYDWGDATAVAELSKRSAFASEAVTGG